MAWRAVAKGSVWPVNVLLSRVKRADVTAFSGFQEFVWKLFGVHNEKSS
jgi:hypothetical protein